MNKHKTLAGALMGVLVLIYCIACAFFQDVSLWYGLGFILFQIFGIVSVGHAIQNLLKLETRNWLESFGISYALGYAMNIVCYFISFPFFGKIGLQILFFLTAFAALAYNIFLCKNKRIKIVSTKDSFIVLLILVILAVLQFLIFACNNFSTSFTGVNTYYCDLFYWSSDAVTFTKQFPPINFRVIDSGRYYYHYFSSIQMAVVSMILDIPVINLTFGFSFIQSCIFLTFGSYIFFRQLFKSSYCMLVGMVLFLFSTGLELISWVGIVSHVYTAPFGYDIGLIYGMLAVVFMLRQVSYKKWSYQYFIVVTLFFSVCMGAKSPTACIVLLILGCICLYMILSQRDKETLIISMIYGIVLLVLFMLLFLFINNGPISGGSKLEQFVASESVSTVLQRQEVRNIHDILITQFSKIPGEVLFLVYYAILVNPALYIGAVFSGFVLLIHNKRVTYKDIIFAIISVVGLVLTRKLQMVGFSQIYFVMATMPYLAAFVAKGIECCIMKEENGDRSLYHIWLGRVVSVALILMGIYYFSNSFAIVPQVTSGLKKLGYVTGIYEEDDIYISSVGLNYKTSKIDDEIRRDYHYIVIDEEEIQAAKWLRENTDEDTIIISDVIDTSNTQYNYSIAVVAERWIWMADPEIIQSAIAGNVESIFVLKERGIRYMLIKNANADIWEKDSIVYSNEKVAIVDLQYGE